ncbi:MAG: DUF1573 domain-containing protein [Planctomycetota bacterium]|jgi:hypothetical protein
MRLGYAILLTIAVTGFGCDQTARESSAEMEEAAEAEAAVRAQKPKPVIVRTGLPAVSRGPLKIDPGGFDLGTIPPHSAYETMATLSNNGSAPMTITSAKSSCMCTVPKGLEGSVIPPGGSHPFSMTFTTSDAPGAKDAKVWVYFEAGGEAQHLMVRIEADVALVVRSEPPYVDALNGVASGTVRIESTDGKPFSILSTYGGDPVFADGFDPQVDDARTAYTLQWDVAFPTMSGCDNAKLWWVVETDHPDCPVLPLRIRHDCTGLRADADHQQRGWIFREYLANLGSVKAGVPVEVEVDLRRLPSLQRISVTSVESLSEDVTAELVEAREGEGLFTTCTVRFTAHRGVEGLVYAMVKFSTASGDKDVAFVARVQS